MDRQQCEKEDSIQVLIRIKPGCDDEAVVYTYNEIKLDRHSFAFDRIFPPQAEQEDIFNAVGKKIISHTLEGYHSCIFAYGQTGSGKTYTMMGNNNGLMQRSFCQIYTRLDRLVDSECIVSCSYYELYNEQIIDLLDGRKDKKNLNIRQDVKKGVFVQNLTEESALNSDKLLECLNFGMKNRHMGQTLMNRQSSRSHSIFTISLAIKSEIDGKKVMKTPKLHFVDLAGSERQKMTMSSGERLKEAGNINKSLTTLGMVINALASDKPKTHIPYRDSKLTCLLRDSLGGNSKTFIVATISTSILCFQETLSTLNFANRAKMVKVKALINEESLSTNIEQFKQEIKKLKIEIARLKTQKRVNFESRNASDSVISKNNGDLSYKFQQLSLKIQDLKSSMVHSNMDDVMNLLNRSKNQRMSDENTIVENECIQEQGNQLIQYMMSNHELLRKIHSTVTEYTSLREQIKNVEITKRMPLEVIKTPSKFQRDQYEQLLEKRQIHIKQLEERICTLKQANFKKDIENRDLRRKLTSIQDHTQSEQQKITRLRNDQQALQKKNSELQLKYELLFEDKLKMEKNGNELEARLKELKQLYIYSQEKYENEKFINAKLQSNLKQIHKKYQASQQQKREQIENYKGKLQIFEQKLMELERGEEELKMEIDILNETVQFDKKKIKEYSEKITQSNRVIQQLNFHKLQLNQKVTQMLHQKQSLVIQYERIIGDLNLKNKQLSNNFVLFNQQLKRVQDKNAQLSKQYDQFMNRSKEKIASLEQELLMMKQLHRSIKEELESTKIIHQKQCYQYNLKIFQLEKGLSNTRAEIQVERNVNLFLEEKYAAEKQRWFKQKQKLIAQSHILTEDLHLSKQQLSQRARQVYQLELQVLSTKNIVEQHQQLKKTYKDVIKQNYKLKGQYISTSTNNLNESAKNQELLSKVAYYEEKFKLMSIQYNKVQEISKKLKQKELNLLKKLEFYEQNQKLKKIHSSSESQEIKVENMKLLQLQNNELKQALGKLTKLYQYKLQSEKKEDYSKRLSLEHEKYELEQKQQKIRKKLESAIKNWDHVKENNCSGMNLDELFGSWQKIQNQSRKKIEGIHKSIKRQQKLKIQNGFIIKENAYLKERVEGLERQINLSILGEPRKQIKLNEDQ